eukprot:631642-Pelagomonas_calceolata.AAC.7
MSQICTREWVSLEHNLPLHAASFAEKGPSIRIASMLCVMHMPKALRHARTYTHTTLGRGKKGNYTRQQIQSMVLPPHPA